AGWLNGFFNTFNRNFEKFRAFYRRVLERVLSGTGLVMLAYAVIVALLVFLFWRMPTGFLPGEDQGYMITQITLPSGATQDRTMAVAKEVAHHFLVDEKANVDFTFTVAGFSFSGAGQNAGIAFTHLRDWSERSGYKNSAQAIADPAMQKFFMMPGAQIYTVVPPADQELGNSNGFDLEMEDRGNLGHAGLMQA